MDFSTPITPPVAPAPDQAAVPSDPLDALLRQIIGGWFVLTDGQGTISKWSEPAELLFGRETPEALGVSFFDALLSGRLSEDAEQWRRFLAAGDPPRGRARVDVQGRHEPTGETFPMEAVFVPVKLDEGFDFSLFLEDLSFELPVNLMQLRMRQQHPVVVRALRAALDPHPQPWDSGRTAGTLVAFRPLGPTPWVEWELQRRAEEKARADAELEEALSHTDPGIQGEFGDLDDAAAVVARLLSALERIDELERMAGRLPAEVEEAKREAQRGHARAESAEREAQRARSELTLVQHAASAAGADPELLARVERLERSGSDEAAALLARVEQVERERSVAVAETEERLAAALGAAGQRGAAGGAPPRGGGPGGGGGGPRGGGGA